MTRRTILTLVDDLDDTELSDGGHTVAFGFERTQYEIDLSPNNVRRLQDALAPFMAAGRRVKNHPSRRPPAHDVAHRVPSSAMRVWAREQGFEVANRGRVSREVQDLYFVAVAFQKGFTPAAEPVHASAP